MITKDDIPNIFGSLFAGIFFTIPLSLFWTIVILKSDFQIFTFDIGFLRYIGAIIILLGILMTLWCFFVLTLVGKGIPLPTNSLKKFIAFGLYRYNRNPMATGFSLIWIGEGILFESPGLFICAFAFIAIYHTIVLFIEEPKLRANFGESYERYCNEVPRWIPRLTPYLDNE